MNEKDVIALKSVLRVAVIAHVEIAALKAVICGYLGVPQEQLDAVVAQSHEAFAPTYAKLDRAPVEQLLALLRDFEGPIQ